MALKTSPISPIDDSLVPVPIAGGKGYHHVCAIAFVVVDVTTKNKSSAIIIVVKTKMSHNLVRHAITVKHPPYLGFHLTHVT